MLASFNNIEISDISPLSSLVMLTDLKLRDNTITDVGALEEMTGLERLNLTSNTIRDIAPLAGLIYLSYLGLNNNDISDIGAVSDLMSLADLDLGGNNISDIAPLVENLGFGVDDSISITDNPLDCQDETTLSHLDTLDSRWVQVSSDCF